MVIGIDDALIFAAVSAAASAGAGYLSTQETNDMNSAMNWRQFAQQQQLAQSQHWFNVDMMRETNERNRYDAAVSRDWTQDQARQAREFNAAEAAKARDWSDYQAQIARSFNQAEAGVARGWSEQMSNTAYQRAMNDMRAAGLNPILAYSQGGASTPTANVASSVAPSATGASTSIPGGATASASGFGASQGSAPSTPRMESALGPAVASALQGANTVMNLRDLAARTEATEANAALLRTNEQLANAQIGNTNAQTISEGHRANLISRQAASEALTPNLRIAQTAAHSAQAAASAENVHTQREEQARLRALELESRERGHNIRQDTESTRLYGRTGAGPVERYGAPIGAAVGNPAEFVRRLLR